VSENAPRAAQGFGQTALRILRETAGDVGVGLFWAALIVAIVLFSGVATQFAYVDF
jgi:hypothetical protein